MRQARRIFSPSRNADVNSRSESYSDELSRREEDTHLALTSNRSPDAVATQARAESGDDVEEEQFYGLFELWPNLPAGELTKIETSIDVIAVHGLTGDAFKTWTKSDRLWLREFLPNECPEARILTFGYDASVAFAKSESRIPDFASQLLATLQALRRRTKSDPSYLLSILTEFVPTGHAECTLLLHSMERKIIFICHSLGGIVVKQALITAHALSGKYGWFTKNTVGIVFMGTPHHGSDTAYWGRILGNMANMPIRNVIKTELLKDLQPKSNVLGDICSAFPERSKSLNIYTFFERIKTSGLNSLVVDKDSAMLYLPNETAVPLETDHRDLCRFLTSSNQSYLLVVDAILAIIESAKPAPEILNVGEDELRLCRQLERMDFKLMLESVPGPKNRSCQWLLGHQSFQAWRDSSNVQSIHSQFLWIFGPPGSGKTVIMKFIINYLKNLMPQINASVNHNIAYFFCDDKVLQRTNKDELLASLLHQFISSNSTLSFMKQIEQKMLGRLVLLDTPDVEEMMWKSLLNCIQKCPGNIFWVVIDALDELTVESREKVIIGLQRLLEGDWSRRLKLLVSSRSRQPSSLISQITEHPLYLDLRNIHTRADVDRLLEVQAAKLCKNLSQYFSVSRELQDEFQASLKRLADGNFLQANLALANFEQITGDWTKTKFLKHLKQVQETPTNLQDFYCKLLRQIPNSYESTAKLVFSCILASVEPLTIQDLELIVTLRDDHRSYEHVKADIPANFYLTFEEHCGFLVVKDERGKVQLRHQTAKELLLGTTGVSESSQEILGRYKTSMPDAHFTLANVCLKVLSWSDYTNFNFSAQTKAELCRAVPNNESCRSVQAVINTMNGPSLLAYAAQNWSEHCEKVSGKQACSDAIFNYFSKPNFDLFRLALAQLETELYRFRREATPEIILKSPPLHYLLQKGDFPQVVRKLLQSGADVNELDAHGLSPLHWAVSRGRQDSFHLLIHYSGVNINRRAKDSFYIIHQCVEWNRADILQSLLEDERLKINVQDRTGNTALSLSMLYAAHRSTSMIVKMILDKGKNIDFTWRSDTGLTLLELAFKTRQSEIIIKELLKRHDTKFDALTMNILRSAGDIGSFDIEKIIIRSHTNEAFKVDPEGMNILTTYAYFGRKTNLVRLLELLGPDAFSMHQQNGRYDLLHLCAHQDWEDVVLLLQSKFKMKSLDSDHYCRTILHWAVEYGWDLTFLDFPLTSPVWINRQDRDGLTALHLAVNSHNTDAVKMLVDNNASFLLKDREGSNAVHCAAKQGFSAAIKIFLAEDVREYERTRTGAGLLHLLALWSDRAIIESYVTQKKPIINVLDKEHKTPLHYAALCGNEGVVEYFLDNDANIDSTDLAGQTPLHCAIREGQLSTVQRLVQAGADLWKQDKYKQSCLQLSIRSGKQELFQYMLENVDSVKNRDIWGKNALHHACKLGDANLITELLRRGIDCNTYDNYSQTPLHIAVVNSNIAAVRALLNDSPRGKLVLSPKDRKGTTPLDRALYNDHEALIVLLGSWNAESTQNYKLKIGLEDPYVKKCQGHSLEAGPLRQIEKISFSPWPWPPAPKNSDAAAPNVSNNKAHSPKCKAQLNTDEHESKQQQEQQQRHDHGRETPPSQSQAVPGMVTNLGWAGTNCSWQGNVSSALSFAPGQVIRIIQKQSQEWWIGEINNVQGVFPVNYTHPIFSPDTPHTIVLLIHSARNVWDKSSFSFPDAYVSISTPSTQHTLRSWTQKNTLNPIWAESFVLDVMTRDTLIIQLFNEQRQQNGRLGSLGFFYCNPLSLLQHYRRAWDSGMMQVPLQHRENPDNLAGLLYYSVRVA